MRFREHRGLLCDSLETTIEIADRAALLAKVNGMLFPSERPIEDHQLLVEPHGGDDTRIGWKDVHIVYARGRGVFGFIEGNP